MTQKVKLAKFDLDDVEGQDLPEDIKEMLRQAKSEQVAEEIAADIFQKALPDINKELSDELFAPYNEYMSNMQALCAKKHIPQIGASVIQATQVINGAIAGMKQTFEMATEANKDNVVDFFKGTTQRQVIRSILEIVLRNSMRTMTGLDDDDVSLPETIKAMIESDEVTVKH